MYHLGGHQQMLYGTIFTILILIIAILSRRPRIRRTAYTTTTQSECTNIVAGRNPRGIANTLSALEARAYPNTRLIYTFGIDNAFTTVDGSRHNKFRNQVLALLKPDWDTVARTAQEQAAQYYPGNLVCLVQSFVLKMTIYVLFERNPSALDNETISFVAAEIDHLWTESKIPRRRVPWSKQHKMHEALGRLIPDCDPLDSQRNPMNLILPAFETMWRVVFRCFIEIRYRGAKERKKWTEALAAYLKSPSPQSGAVCKENADVALVRAIVREALRLYPPTRHIHRHFGTSSGIASLVIADIEGLHRDEEIWGEDAKHFVPARWLSTSLGAEDSKTWMPFGASPFLCPAKQDFGPRMIGILVAALVVEFFDEKYELQKEGSKGQMDVAHFVGPLRTARNSYNELFLEVNAPCA